MRLVAPSHSLLVAAGLMLAIGFTPTASADSLTPVTPSAPMPAFKIPGINGTSASDADLRNKVTIISFWASW